LKNLQNRKGQFMPLWLALIISYFIVGCAFAVIEVDSAEEIYEKMPAGSKNNFSILDCKIFIAILYFFLWFFIIAHRIIRECQ